MQTLRVFIDNCSLLATIWNLISPNMYKAHFFKKIKPAVQIKAHVPPHHLFRNSEKSNRYTAEETVFWYTKDFPTSFSQGNRSKHLLEGRLM